MNILFLFFIVPFVSGVPVYLTSFFTSLLIILQFLEEYASIYISLPIQPVYFIS